MLQFTIDMPKTSNLRGPCGPPGDTPHSDRDHQGFLGEEVSRTPRKHPPQTPKTGVPGACRTPPKPRLGVFLGVFFRVFRGTRTLPMQRLGVFSRITPSSPPSFQPLKTCPHADHHGFLRPSWLGPIGSDGPPKWVSACFPHQTCHPEGSQSLPLQAFYAETRGFLGIEPPKKGFQTVVSQSGFRCHSEVSEV